MTLDHKRKSLNVLQLRGLRLYFYFNQSCIFEKFFNLNIFEILVRNFNDLTTKYDNLILDSVFQWSEIKNVVEKCNGDELEVTNSIKRLISMGFLESRTLKNVILYKKYDKPQTHEQFSKMMDDFLSHQKDEIESIKTIPTIMISDGSQFGFSVKGLQLLEHVQEEIDRVSMVVVRLDHYDKIRILQHPIAQQRIKRLQNHINQIMNIMLDSYKDIHSNVVLQEYFKNHTKIR